MKKSFWLTLGIALATYVLLPLPGQTAPLSSRIEKKRSAIEHVKRREGVLTTTISGYNNRIERLQGEIRGSRQRLGRVQGELDRKRNQLVAVQNKLEISRDRLERLRRRLHTARRVLAARLVEIYKSDPPDALTVVLESDGFADLLDRADFLGRISDQDRGVTTRVRGLKGKSQKQTDQLAGLEKQVRVVATQILQRRDQIASARDQLVSSQTSLRGARNDRSVALASVRTRRHGLEEDLASMEREQARVQAALAGAGNTAFSGPAGPIKRGSGRLIWPVNGPITGAFGEQRPGHIHAGIDIAAAMGTPIRAADSGRVVLMAWTGGYGNYTCIQHTASLSTCYGHQSRFGTSNGASVHQGQVIGFVGSTGHSTGAHLHFETRVNGTPVNPLGYL
jgi:murein DD-endopeptidase MepM/ murein hydrolase activator NlpD